jgi:hypothetical protein
MFNLPTDFIENWILEDFHLLMDKNFIPYDTVTDYLNSTIKEIVVPNFSINVVEQTLKYGKKFAWKEVGSVFDKFNNEIDITFRSVDSHLNYFLLLEIMTEFYENVGKHSIPVFFLQILDKNGDLIYTILFRDILLKSISETRLTYNVQDVSERTFSLTFRYNFIDIRFELKDDHNKDSKSIFDIPIKFKPGLLDNT